MDSSDTLTGLEGSLRREEYTFCYPSLCSRSPALRGGPWSRDVNPLTAARSHECKSRTALQRVRGARETDVDRTDPCRGKERGREHARLAKHLS